MVKLFRRSLSVREKRLRGRVRRVGRSLSRRGDRRLVGARFGRWREKKIGRAHV